MEPSNVKGRPVPSVHGKQMRKKWKQWHFIFLGSKIAADSDCSHGIKRHLLLGRTAMTNLDSMFKSKDISLPTNISIVKSMVFPVVLYGCEKAQCQRTDAFILSQIITIGEDSWEFLDSEEMRPVNPKENQPWIFFGRTELNLKLQ